MPYTEKELFVLYNARFVITRTWVNEGINIEVHMMIPSDRNIIDTLERVQNYYKDFKAAPNLVFLSVDEEMSRTLNTPLTYVEAEMLKFYNMHNRKQIKVETSNTFKDQIGEIIEQTSTFIKVRWPLGAIGTYSIADNEFKFL